MFIKLSKFWNHQVKQSSFKECHYNDISISICIELIPNMDMYLAGHALITKCQIYYTLSLSLLFGVVSEMLFINMVVWFSFS